MIRKKNVPLYASHNFVEALMSMKHRIAQVLSDHIKYRAESQISYLDFGDTNDTISFIYSNKLSELRNTYGDRYREYVWNSKRSQMKIGKIIKMIYNTQFPINQPKDAPRKSVRDDIESFVNMYKSYIDKGDNLDRFEIVKGDSIRFWYDQDNYSRFIREDTTLAKSCLRYKDSGKFLELMVRNPDLVNMLILKDDANKLRGRALVWNLTEPTGRVFMDRIYTVNDSDVELYKSFAVDNGWLYKSRQTFGYDHNIVDGKTGDEHAWNEMLLKVQLKNKPQRYYPYLDTLCVYNHEEYSVCNNGDLLRKPPHYRLADYQGSYIDEADYREMVYSDTYGYEIPREESEYATIDQSWIYTRDITHVHNTNGETANKSGNKVKKSLILGKTKYFLNDDCVYSKYLNTWIFKESIREVYVDMDKTEKGLVHRKTLGKIFNDDGTGDFVLTIIPVAKRKNSDFTNDEYTNYIKKVLRNGRADLRHVMSGELFIDFNRKSTYKNLSHLKSNYESLGGGGIISNDPFGFDGSLEPVDPNAPRVTATQSTGRVWVDAPQPNRPIIRRVDRNNENDMWGVQDASPTAGGVDEPERPRIVNDDIVLQGRPVEDTEETPGTIEYGHHTAQVSGDGSIRWMDYQAPFSSNPLSTSPASTSPVEDNEEVAIPTPEPTPRPEPTRRRRRRSIGDLGTTGVTSRETEEERAVRELSERVRNQRDERLIREEEARVRREVERMNRRDGWIIDGVEDTPDDVDGGEINETSNEIPNPDIRRELRGYIERNSRGLSGFGSSDGYDFNDWLDDD